jgi:hypothetical protein
MRIKFESSFIKQIYPKITFKINTKKGRFGVSEKFCVNEKARLKKIISQT